MPVKTIMVPLDLSSAAVQVGDAACELAELGTSSETLSRTLARLRDATLITVAAKSIAVHDAARLEAMLRRNLGET